MYSQLLRIKRIVDDPKLYNKHVENKLDEFRIKEFPEHILTQAKIKAETIPREDLLKPKNRDPKNCEEIILTTTFRPQNKKLPKLV